MSACLCRLACVVGLFAFEVIDRITAGSLNMAPPWWMSGINEYFIGTPGVWFAFNMVRQCTQQAFVCLLCARDLGFPLRAWSLRWSRLLRP